MIFVSLLLQVMPRLGLDEQELRAIVESACKEPPKGLSKMMQGILAMSDGRCKTEDVSPQTSNIDHLLWDWGEQIEMLSEEFPLLKAVFIV